MRILSSLLKYCFRCQSDPALPGEESAFPLRLLEPKQPVGGISPTKSVGLRNDSAEVFFSKLLQTPTVVQESASREK